MIVFDKLKNAVKSEFIQVPTQHQDKVLGGVPNTIHYSEIPYGQGYFSL